MPCIHIRTGKVEHRVNIEDFSYQLSQKMDIPIERMNVIVDYYEKTDVFIGRNTDFIIITLWVSEANEKEFIRNLAKTTAALAEKYFHKKEKSAAVMCNLMREGYLFIHDQFI
ncbi:hypothetical protein SAMN05660297_02083 [Natronincola peptidivorans]|uniref:Tautomerase enzyme n=1 Tax=Natronincola peptidivorans TaxID=426128 RepID=A0A1I0DMW6_9FIRM|nr:hypothetical protein [Natronincola peptidivorans]SET33877.1 hypothetical protein SAMN05660297_02083 [Natronincola peptidivorans]